MSAPAWRLPALAALFAIAIRVPFLGQGYGWDSDAWRMAGAAQSIAETGRYVASRAPGYPLTELVDAALARLGPWGASPWTTNGLRALWAGVAAASFAVLARRLRLAAPLFLACAFTSVPAIFVAGTVTLDTMPSLALGTVALLLAHARRPVLAGLAVGLAAGMRPTGLVFALPVVAMLRGRDALVAAAVAVVVAALGYAPAYLAGGAASVTYYDLGYPALSLVVKKATLDLWGLVGFTGLAIAAAWSLVRGATDSRARGPALDANAAAADRRAHTALVLGLIAFVALYLRLPYKALYLAPAVVFALFLFARWARPNALRFALGGLVLAPWLGSLYEPGKFDDPAPSALGATLSVRGHAMRLEARGPALMDHARRRKNLEQGQAVVAAARALPSPSLVVAGDLLPMVRVSTGAFGEAPGVGRARFVHHLEATDLRAARDEGRAIYIAPGGLGSPAARFGEDAVAAGAKALVLPDTHDTPDVPVPNGDRP